MDEPGREPVEELDLEPPSVVRDRRPPVLWAVLAFIGLVAGGLVVSSASDDGEPRPGLPVDLAAASRAGGSAAEAAADAMLAWVVYVPGDDLPALGGEATAYRLSRDVSEAQVSELADALGLEGEVQSDGAGSWSVTGDGGEGRLDVHAGGGAGWSYFGGYSDCADADGSIGGCSGAGAGENCVQKGDVTECTFAETSTAVACPASADCELPPTTTTVVSCPDDTSDSDPRQECVDDGSGCKRVSDDQTVCVDPPPADTGSDCNGDDCIAPCGEAALCPDVVPSPDLPDEDDARAAALAVAAASGADVDGARVTADSGFNSWYVTVEPEVDGLPSGLISYIEVGPDVRVISGGGVIGQPEPLGEYPLLDTQGAIDRANAQSGSFGEIEPGVGAADRTSSTTGGTAEGGTDVETSDDGQATVSTVIDACSVPDGASDGCGGTTGCGGDGCVEPTMTIPCKVQADGSEICEVSGCENGTMSCPPAEPCPADGQRATTVPCLIPECPQVAAADDVAVGAPEVVDCAPPPDPIPLPEPQPVEIVLVDAERSLVLLPANDGTGDAYLVPAYRFTAADGGTVDLPAVADEAVAGPVTTETTVPDTVIPEPAPVPVPEPQPCEVLEEQDPGTGTTHTIQTCPTPDEDALVIGEGYYVDIDVECAGGSFELGGRIWITDDEEVAGWADPGERHEGGTFTLDAEDHGTFVGDAAGTLVAEFRTLGPANEDIFCTPEPR